MARLFVAVVPPAPVLERLRGLDRPADAGVRWVPEHQWHVTLRFLGDGDPSTAADALARVESPRAFVELGPAVGRLGERVICVPVAGLDDLAAAVRAVTDDLGGLSAPEPFRGHLTLGRARADDTAVPLVGQPFSVRFVADRMVLFESRQGAGGHHHEAIASWWLGGGQDRGVSPR